MPTPSRVMASCKLGQLPLYSLVSFNSGITVLSQQTRALNLAWALVESGNIDCLVPYESAGPRKKIAIIGGGFAGLTFAAGLLAKRANADLTIFEERDTLLPLQHGSDSRWLHPQIYNWPGPGSEVNVAMLPVMNWTASRASDVAVQVLEKWKVAIAESVAAKIVTRLFCNARHLQIQKSASTAKLRIEWVAEERQTGDATTDGAINTSVGSSEEFDHVILAVGFGLEIDQPVSYWRNEELAQPVLDQPRKAYLISGQGDSAMIDLLRLRVSQFRQDRILEQLFATKSSLLPEIERLHQKHAPSSNRTALFRSFEALYLDPKTCGSEFRQAAKDLRTRLRRDTEAILRLKEKSFAALFGPGTSFQNRLLVYLLFKCGGFIPTNQSDKAISEQYAISDGCVIRRHGTLRDAQFERVLSPQLLRHFRRDRKTKSLSVTDQTAWAGGYFGFYGRERTARSLPNPLKKTWRKEYLPDPTRLIAASFCAAIAGLLHEAHPKNERLRVTLHRTIVIGKEELLQQSCDYEGIKLEKESSSGRTFPAGNATIGLAYKTRKIVRSKRGISPHRLKRTMTKAKLSTASSEMNKEVGFVLAIPLLEPSKKFTFPSPVLAVIYIDSTARNFFIDDGLVRTLVLVAQQLLDSLTQPRPDDFGTVRNFLLSRSTSVITSSLSLPSYAKQSIDLVPIAPPVAARAFQLNYDYSDFTPVKTDNRG